MPGRHPAPDEADPYFFRYIDQVEGDDILLVLTAQLDEALTQLKQITEEQSLAQPAPDKWTLKETLNHLTDTERIFAFRAFWFARGFDSALPSFDQLQAAAAAGAHSISWQSHVAEFYHVRLSTLDFFRHLPADAWNRTGTASGYRFSVRALAFLIAGHVAHHLKLLRAAVPQ